MKNLLWLACLFILHFSFFIVCAQAQALVTVADTLRNADNALASGRLEISWPAFKTADGFTVAAGRKNHTVTTGVVNLQLFPNAGATPSGTSYTVDYYLTSGAGREYWVVPAAGPVTIAGIRVSVAPAPSILISQNQLALGTGLNVLLGLSRWASGAQPAATVAGQCYYDNTADLLKCSNNALAFTAPPPGGAAGGDLGGSFPNPTVARASTASFAVGSASKATLSTSALTADRTFTFPDSSGTVALAADIGIKSLNSLTAAVQLLSTGTSGSDFSISSSATTHSFNLPNASATARGVVSTGNQTFTGEKLVDTSSANLAGVTALYGILRPTNSSGTMFYAQGVEGDVISTAAGTVDTVAGVASYAQQSGAGTINTLSGFLVNPNTKFAGTVVNNYGVLVGDQAIAGANNWAIKTLSGKVEFGDQVVAKNINAVRYANQFASVQAAINDCPASKCTVYVPAGTYSITSLISVNGKTNFALILDKGAVLQAASGIGANPVLQVEGTSADVLIQGGIFDANSIAGMGIQVAGTATRVRIQGVEVKNTTGGNSPGIQVVSTAAGGYEVEVSDSYIHETAQSCIFFQYPGVAKAINNRCANPGAHGMQGGGQQLFVALHNKISGATATNQNGIYCFGCDRVDWRGNEVTNSYRGMHCDTCGAGNVRGNLIDNVNHWGIHVENSADVSIHDNEIRNNGTTVTGDGLALTGTASNSINVLDSTTGLTAAANVTLSADAGDKQEGAASVQAAVAAGFTTGLVFHQDFGSNQATFLLPFKDIWVKSDVAISAGVLSLGTDSTAACASFDRTVKLPFVPANTWVRLQQFLPSWQYDAQVIGVRCWGIFANSDPGVVTLHFDDFRAAARSIGNVVSNNRVYWPAGVCFNFGNMIGGTVQGNYCEDPEYRSSTARRAYNFSAATNPIASNNDARFTAKTITQAGQFFILDATSTVTEVNNRGTNVDTFASITAGGTLLRLDPDLSGSTFVFDGATNTYIQVKSTAAGTPTAYVQGGSAGKAVFGSLTNHPLSFTVNQTERATLNSSGVMGATVFDASTGFRVGGAAASGNVLRGNGTNFVSAQLAAADLSNGTTGSGAAVLQTSPSMTSPTLAGTPVLGDGAGNDKLSFAAESTNPSCAGGNFYIWANSSDNRLKKCQNGTISDLDTTASGGGYDTLKGDSGTASRTGTEAIKIAGTAGEISTSAADGTDDTVTLSLASTLSTAKTVSALWTFDRGTTSDQAILIAIAQPGAAGQRDSHFLDLRGTSFDTAGHNADWRTFVDVTSNAAASSFTWQSRIDAASFTTRAALSDGGVFDVATGFRIGGAAASGRFLRGNGTNFVQSAGAASGTGSCTNQFVRAVNDDAAPTCATVGAADVDETTFSSITWLANADSTWTFDTTGATSPVISFTGANINVSTGTLQEGGVAVSLPSRTETLTNKTLDVEGTGNTVTTVEKIWIPAATCVAATATLNWDDDPAAAEPTAACVAGTNTTKGVADFLDSATNAVQTHVKLPADWTGAVDVKFVWFTTVTTNNVVWQIQGACVADAETDDPSFGTASTVTDVAKGTANQLNDASISGIQSNFAGSCAAGELLHLRALRDPAHASDNLGATARLYGIELSLRRAQ